MSIATSASPSSAAAARGQAQFGLYDLGLYVFTVFAWSTSWIALKNQLGVVAPEVSLTWRFGLAMLMMWALVVVKRLPWRYGVADHLRFFATGALLFSTNFALFYYGGLTIPSGLLSVIFSLASVFNLILGALLLGHRFDLRVLFGGLIGVVGVGLMFWPQIGAGSFNGPALVGLGLCIAGTTLFCLGNMLSSVNQKRGMPVFATNAWAMLYGTALLAATAALRGEAFIIEPTLKYLGSLGYLSVVSTVIAFWCYLTLLGRIGASRAGYSTVMTPVFALAISTVYEGYVWTVPAVAGLLLVMAGNLFVLRRGAAKA